MICSFGSNMEPCFFLAQKLLEGLVDLWFRAFCALDSCSPWLCLFVPTSMEGREESRLEEEKKSDTKAIWGQKEKRWWVIESIVLSAAYTSLPKTCLSICRRTDEGIPKTCNCIVISLWRKIIACNRSFINVFFTSSPYISCAESRGLMLRTKHLNFRGNFILSSIFLIQFYCV